MIPVCGKPTGHSRPKSRRKKKACEIKTGANPKPAAETIVDVVAGVVQKVTEQNPDALEGGDAENQTAEPGGLTNRAPGR